MYKQNRPPADLFPDENEGDAPVASLSPTTWEHQFFGEFGRVARFTTQASGDEDVECAKRIVDNSKTLFVSAQSHVITPGAVGAQLVVRYSPTLSPVSWSDLIALRIDQSDPVIPRTVGPLVLPGASKVKNLLLKLVRRGDFSTVTPEMWNFIVSATSARGPLGTPIDPLPEGEWGNVIHDLHAKRLLANGNFADDEEVDYWPDDSVSRIDAVASIGVPPGPRFQSAGWPGGLLPCVRWPGGNTNPMTFTPSPTNGDFTLYMVVANLDAGAADPSNMYASDGFPFSKLLQVQSGQVGAGVNVNLLGGFEWAADTWGMSDPHIYRLSFKQSIGHWWLAVDGELVADEAVNPQATEAVNTVIGQHGALAMTMDLAREATYNKCHVTPDMSSVTAWTNGLTEPEQVLQAIWGTP